MSILMIWCVSVGVNLFVGREDGEGYRGQHAVSPPPLFFAGEPEQSHGTNHYVIRSHILLRWWVNAFFQGIQPFMDPVTKEKVRRIHLFPGFVDDSS
jgi:hypothetical protein